MGRDGSELQRAAGPLSVVKAMNGASIAETLRCGVCDGAIWLVA
jgi:hypothetical protein